MIELRMIRDLVAIFGVIAGFKYYVINVRNAQKTRELSLKAQELSLKAQEQALETRQTQIFMQIYEQLNSKETHKSFMELMNQEIGDYNEYLKKYDSSVNPAHYATRAQIWYSYNQIGELLRRGIIEPELVHPAVGTMVVLMWEKWVDIIKEVRVRENIPDI
jgi:hypothetical protein